MPVLLLLLLLTVAPAGASGEAAPARIDGTDRFDTAARIAELSFDPDTTDAAIVARADAFPDALTAAGLAGAVGAPVLLVEQESVPERTLAALEILDVQRIVVLGGPAAVSEAVVEHLAKLAGVTRVAGEHRYATAAAIAAEIARVAAVGTVNGRRAALITTGEAFPDALTAGPLAAHNTLPILLAYRDRLPAATRAAITELDIGHALVIGGPAAITGHALAELADLGVRAERIAGPNRAATAARVADTLVERFGFDPHHVVLARGDAFPDALAAAPHAARRNAPLLLTADPTHLGADAAAWLRIRCPNVAAVQAVGGREAIAVAVLDAAVDAAERCSERTITYEIGARGQVHGDEATFRQRVAEALRDAGGWSLTGALRFVPVASGGDLQVILASPEEIDAAHPVCSPQWSCRVGDNVYINDVRWREATETYANRPLTEYRWYVVNHEVGHWLGLGHWSCPGQGRAAPVMQQQSISLDGCVANVWPLPGERAAVRARWLD